MKIVYRLAIIFIGFTLASCAHVSFTEQPKDPSTKKTLVKNPLTVTCYPNGTQPTTPYKIIGKESVAEYNAFGIKRQQAVVRDNLRQLAAAIGGDGIINIKQEGKFVVGTVILYRS